MSYYIRYISIDETPTSLPDLVALLNIESPGYSLDDSTLSFNGRELAFIVVNHPDEELFEQEIAELIEFAEEVESEDPNQAIGQERVLDGLRAATEIIAFQILSAGEEKTFEYLEPVWVCLDLNRKGMLQADGQGYFIAGELVLAE